MCKLGSAVVALLSAGFSNALWCIFLATRIHTLISLPYKKEDIITVTNSNHRAEHCSQGRALLFLAGEARIYDYLTAATTEKPSEQKTERGFKFASWVLFKIWAIWRGLKLYSRVYT